MENDDLMSEVEAKITKILSAKIKMKKNDKINVCKDNNLIDCYGQLLQEFDYLDINSKKEKDFVTKKGLKKVIIQLINNSFNLLKLQNDTQEELSVLLNKNNCTANEINYLRKVNETLRKELKTKEIQLKVQQEHQKLDKRENEELKLKIQNANRNLSLHLKENLSAINHYKLEAQKAMSLTQSVQKKFYKKADYYQNFNTQHIEAKYGEKNLKKIEALQSNNQQLLEEIVNLRSELDELKFMNAYSSN